MFDCFSQRKTRYVPFSNYMQEVWDQAMAVFQEDQYYNPNKPGLVGSPVFPGMPVHCVTNVKYQIRESSDKATKTVEVCVPGFTKEQIKIQFFPDYTDFKTSCSSCAIISIVGNHKETKEKRFYTDFALILDLPSGSTFINALLENGVLHVYIKNPVPQKVSSIAAGIDCKID